MFATLMLHGFGKRPVEAKSRAQLLALFDTNVTSGRVALMTMSDEHLLETVSFGGVSMPRTSILRRRVFSHMIHHRGQMSVYLRLLGVAVPGIYGPSADEGS